jgi:hypothetical protein
MTILAIFIPRASHAITNAILDGTLLVTGTLLVIDMAIVVIDSMGAGIDDKRIHQVTYQHAEDGPLVGAG